MKRLLIIMPELFWGGAERQFRYLISDLRENVIACVIHAYSGVSTMNSEEQLYLDEHKETVFIYEERNYKNRIKRLLALGRMIHKAIKLYGAEAALVYDIDGCCLIPYMRLNGLEIIYSERNSGDGITDKKLFKHRLLNRVVRMANHITCNSENAQKVLQENLNVSVKYIKNGIECTDKFNPRTSECSIMLVPARIASIKNQQLIIEFLHNHSEFQGDVKFAGKSEDLVYENELRQSVKNYGLEKRVFFLGFQEDMDKLYKSGCFVVLPSFHEGMANVILECFARGIPIFVSNIPENRFTEYLQEFSFDPNDSEGLAKCIEKWNQLTVSERKAILEANYDYVCKEHSIEKMVNEYKQLLF